jgi:hypothetical protein
MKDKDLNATMKVRMNKDLKKQIKMAALKFQSQGMDEMSSSELVRKACQHYLNIVVKNLSTNDDF